MQVFYFNLFVSITLIVGGIFVSPLGIIDDNVLTAVDELLMFSVLAQFPKILDAVRKSKLFGSKREIRQLKSLPVERKKVTKSLICLFCNPFETQRLRGACFWCIRY